MWYSFVSSSREPSKESSRPGSYLPWCHVRTHLKTSTFRTADLWPVQGLDMGVLINEQEEYSEKSTVWVSLSACVCDLLGPWDRNMYCLNKTLCVLCRRNLRVPGWPLTSEEWAAWYQRVWTRVCRLEGVFGLGTPGVNTGVLLSSDSFQRRRGPKTAPPSLTL